MPSRERVAPAVGRREEEAEPAVAAAIVVKLDRDTEREAQAAAVAGRNPQEALGRVQPPERDWSSERVFAVRLRVPTGAEQIERMGLSGEEAARVVQRAVDRAYPFLEREGIRDNFVYDRIDEACGEDRG
jgi:hypothetical protein